MLVRKCIKTLLCRLAKLSLTSVSGSNLLIGTLCSHVEVVAKVREQRRVMFLLSLSIIRLYTDTSIYFAEQKGGLYFILYIIGIT